MGHASLLSLLPRASSPLSSFSRHSPSSLPSLPLFPRGPRLGPTPPQPRALPFLPRSLSLAVADRGTPPVGVVPFPAPEPDSSSSPSSTDPAAPSLSRARTPGRRSRHYKAPPPLGLLPGRRRAPLAPNPNRLCSPLPCTSGRRHAVFSPPSAVA
jgi:hypothetical protein